MSFEQLISLELSNVLAVLAIAASPLSELRGAIPVAISAFNFPWYYALLISVIGNLLPAVFILVFLDTISRWLSKVRFFDQLLKWLFERTRRQGKIIERYERIGLALFIAIPLPVTGAWTGSVIAVLLGLKFRYAFLSIFTGVLIAGIIVTSATLLGWAVFGLLET